MDPIMRNLLWTARLPTLVTPRKDPPTLQTLQAIAHLPSAAVPKELVDFWSVLFTQEPYGSGDRQTYFSGWVADLVPYDVLGLAREIAQGEVSRLESDEIPSSVMDCPVEVDDNGTPYHVRVESGFLGFSFVSPSTPENAGCGAQACAARTGVSPTIGYAVHQTFAKVPPSEEDDSLDEAL